MISLAVVASSVMTQVIMRFVFSSATAWAEETAVYGMVFAVYFGASLAVRERAHIRITMLVNALPRVLQIICIVLADIAWFGFVCFMLYQSLLFMETAFQFAEIVPGLGIDKKWVQLFLPIGFFFMVFRMLQVYWCWAKSGWEGLPL